MQGERDGADRKEAPRHGGPVAQALVTPRAFPSRIDPRGVERRIEMTGCGQTNQFGAMLYLVWKPSLILCANLTPPLRQSPHAPCIDQAWPAASGRSEAIGHRVAPMAQATCASGASVEP